MRVAFHNKRWMLVFCLCAAAWGNAAMAAQGPIAVIVAPGQARNLKKDDLALLFKRKKLFWGDGVRAQPVNLPASHPLRRGFSQAVLGHTPEELEKYWNDLYFHGISPPYVLASEEAMLRFVAETPGAIGYVPYCSADARVAIGFVIAAGRVFEDLPEVDCGR